MITGFESAKHADRFADVEKKIDQIQQLQNEIADEIAPLMLAEGSRKIAGQIYEAASFVGLRQAILNAQRRFGFRRCCPQSLFESTPENTHTDQHQQAPPSSTDVQ